jgi:hypothetical protein
MSVLGKLTFGALAAAGIYALSKNDGKGQKKQAAGPKTSKADKAEKAEKPAAAAEPAAAKPKARKQRSKRAKRAHAA